MNFLRKYCIEFSIHIVNRNLESVNLYKILSFGNSNFLSWQKNLDCPNDRLIEKVVLILIYVGYRIVFLRSRKLIFYRQVSN